MRTNNFYMIPALVLIFLSSPAFVAAQTPQAASPLQLPKSMHTQMKDHARITVGIKSGDIVGSDNRALQAAVDYVASLGGGTVEIGPGDYLMRDSLHLRAHVTVRGTWNQTVLRKARSAASALKVDGDYGEEQITVVSPAGFEVGDGVAVWDKNSGGFHTTVARITGRDGNTFAISLPLNADCMVSDGAQAATVFPIISGYHVEGARVEDLSIEGDKKQNVNLNGCRGGGIFLYRCHGAVVVRCTVRNYNGDGISFQQCNDVSIQRCLSEGNGRYGISIGHKDTDNLLRNNHVRGNHEDGIFFRNETEGMAGHRNRLENNIIENNGVGREAAGIRVRGETRDLVFTKNIIRDTRSGGARKQVVGVLIEENAGAITLNDNSIDAGTKVEDRRKAKTVSGNERH